VLAQAPPTTLPDYGVLTDYGVLPDDDTALMARLLDHHATQQAAYPTLGRAPSLEAVRPVLVQALPDHSPRWRRAPPDYATLAARRLEALPDYDAALAARQSDYYATMKVVGPGASNSTCPTNSLRPGGLRPSRHFSQQHGHGGPGPGGAGAEWGQQPEPTAPSLASATLGFYAAPMGSQALPDYNAALAARQATALPAHSAAQQPEPTAPPLAPATLGYYPALPVYPAVRQPCRNRSTGDISLVGHDGLAGAW
jgi:hypothetical protein